MANEADGKLKRYIPPGRKPAKRRLYLTLTAWDELTDSSSATNLLAGKGFIVSALTRWTLGDRIYGDEKRCLFLCRLCPPPPEVWEIRITQPDVQVRLFGRFAEPDTLILTKFHTRNFLGKKSSQAWSNVMNECETAWLDLFQEFPPFSGSSIHDYVTENCDDFPI